jgi:hypothetical protein
MIRKTLFTVVAALLVVPAMVQAQSTVTATATIGQHSAVTGSGDLAFGAVDRDNGVVIDATGGTAAQREVEFNHNVTITFDNVPTALTAGTLSLPVSLMCAARPGGTWGTAATCSTASFDLDVGTGLTTVTLGFGGEITAADAAAAVAASYTGTFDVVITSRGT